jgi:hypothetical protein
LIFELESTECELSLADTVKQFDSGKGDGGGVEVLEAENGTSSGFDAAVVLFNQIVQILRRAQLRAFGQHVGVLHQSRAKPPTLVPENWPDK